MAEYIVQKKPLGGLLLLLSSFFSPHQIAGASDEKDTEGIVKWAGEVAIHSNVPEQEINQDIELLMLASDGPWDVMANETEEESEAASRKVTETAISRGSADNIICIVVKFPP